MTPRLVRVLRLSLDHRGTKEGTGSFLQALQGHRDDALMPKSEEVYTEAMMAHLQNVRPPGPPAGSSRA